MAVNTTDVRKALEDAQEILLASNDLASAIVLIAEKRDLRPKQMAVALLVAARSLLEHTNDPWRVDAVWWQAVTLAKDLWTAAGAVQKVKTDGDQG